MFGQHIVHFFGFEMLETRPTQIFVSSFSRVFTFWKDPLIHRLLRGVRFVFLERKRKSN